MKGQLLALGLLWVALTAAAPLPLSPPPPDLASLLPWATTPLDKPLVDLPRLALPPAPAEIPPVVLAPLVGPAGPKPMAPLPPPRPLPCVVGSWLRTAPSESLECGRSRLGRGELGESLRALEAAVQAGTDPDHLVEARYWYGEALYRSERFQDADWQFRQVVQQGGRSEFAQWGLAGNGWAALRLGDVGRARDAFARLAGGRMPAAIEVWVRHGLGLALYGLGRHEEAEKVWAELGARKPAVALSRDVAFWRGEALGRLGRYEPAIGELTVFTRGGSHPLLGVGLVRLGWWSLLGGKPAEAGAAFRSFLGGSAGATDRAAGREREWAEVGLALALAAGGDWEGARRPLNGLDGRRSSLAVPVRVRLAALAVEAGQVAVVQALVQDLLSATLTEPVRAWVLLVKGESHRVEGNRDEARTQFDLARTLGGSSVAGRRATLRLAQMNFELREFAQAVNDLVPLASVADPELRLTVLLLQGEAAYHAGDYAAAAGSYRRALVEFPRQPEARATRLALAWTALRQGQRDDALRQFLEFARTNPADLHAIDALVLASELALAGGNLEQARGLLDRIITNYGSHPRAEFAALNRALLRARSGQPAAQKDLREWIARAPFPPLLGRASAALGVTLLNAGRPAEAAREFARAQQEGFTDFARLGLGLAALAERRWDDARRDLTEARDTGTPEIAATAEYSLAVVGFHRGEVREFAGPAQAVLAAAPRGPLAPRLLYVLTGIRVEEKNWPDALIFAKRLVADFPADEAADDALERVGAGTVQAAAWPLVIETYTLLRQHSPQSPFAEPARLALAQAYFETGRPDEARRELEQFLAALPNDPRAPQAWLDLGRAREAAGDRAGALDAFTRAKRAGSRVTWSQNAQLGHARVLAGERRWEEARGVLEKVLRTSDGPAASEVALRIGDTFDGQGDHLAAAEYYLSAAYLAPQSAVGQRALLDAGRSLAAARQAGAAAIVYRKLLAQASVPANLAAAARKALADLPK